MRKLLTVVSVIALLCALVGVFVASQAATAAGGLRYVRGYSVQGSWLCYGWPNGSYHCTQHWKVVGGKYVSLNPSWVPSQTSSPAPATRPATVVNGVLGKGPCAGKPFVFPRSIGQWTVPSGCYAGVFPAIHSPARPSPGWCNELPEVLRPDLQGYQALHLPSHGGYAPRVGATVYFSPGVQGASGAGHYSVVVAIGPNGWVLSGDENFQWRGGGFNKIIYRFIHVGTGLDFRY